MLDSHALYARRELARTEAVLLALPKDEMALPLAAPTEPLGQSFPFPTIGAEGGGNWAGHAAGNPGASGAPGFNYHCREKWILAKKMAQ